MQESGVDASGASDRGAVLIGSLVEPPWYWHPISTAKLPFPPGDYLGVLKLRSLVFVSCLSWLELGWLPRVTF